MPARPRSPLPRARLAALAALLAALAVAATAWTAVAGALPGERPIAERTYDTVAATGAARLPTQLAAPPVVAVTLLVAAALVLRAWGPRTAVLVPLAAGGAAVAQVAKAAIGPTALFVELNGVPADWLAGNVPSGHAAYVGGVFGLLALLALLGGRRGLAALCALPVAAIGPVLVLTGAHLPGDVLAGLALGLATACGLLALAGPGPGPRAAASAVRRARSRAPRGRARRR